MTCPSCGAAVQPYDRFCLRCGHDMQVGAPARPAPTSSAGSMGPTDSAFPTANGGPMMTSAPYEAPQQQQPPPYSYAATAAPRDDGDRWASGSSIPAPNPYAGGANTVSSGTTINGQRVGGNNGGGLVKSIGAAIVAVFVILGKFGGAIAGLGFFKLFFGWIIVRDLVHSGLGWVALALIALLIIGAIWRSQAA